MNLTHALFIICCMQTAWAHEQAADRISEKEYLRRVAIRTTYEECRTAEQRQVLLKNHPFLCAPRIEGASLILSCIEKHGSLANRYPIEQVQTLLENGVPIDQAGTGRRTALHEAAKSD